MNVTLTTTTADTQNMTVLISYVHVYTSLHRIPTTVFFNNCVLISGALLLLFVVVVVVDSSS